MFFIYITLFFIGFLVMYLVIRSAIDGSETARDIREIRKILSKQYPETIDEKLTSEGDNESEYKPIEQYPVDECPACRSKVLSSDRICPSCGLTIKSDISDI